MPDLGTVEIFTDERGYECRRELQAKAECPRCGKEVDLWAETEEWFERDGFWLHSSYGPAVGDICCNLAIVSDFNGDHVFDLERDEFDCD